MTHSRPDIIRVLCLALFLAPALAARAVAEAPPGDTPVNRLAGESSPYLLLHAHNPVDWYPWGEEALARARRENKPIFLSVGYSTCYWCHVMEREVFSNPEIAALMNQWFVNIKVDREERPDLDEIYMTATQLLTRGGGWPNSVFLTPDLRPFFAGTYMPPEDRGGRPGFPTILRRIHQAWTDRRQDLEDSSMQIGRAMERVLAGRREAAPAPPGPHLADAAIESLKARYDPDWGGFGSAPKFPSPASLLLLEEVALRGDEEASRIVTTTLEKMSRGGIFDQLAGGFHRYSTDREWLIPHFEKMLYDNAYLAQLTATHGARRQDRDLIRVARSTLDFVLADMTLPSGAFKSAIDAETAAEEGAYYTWTGEELRETLASDFDLMAEAYGFAGSPNFESDRYALFLPLSPAQLARRKGWTEEELWRRLAAPRRRLLERRGQRDHPLVDDKVLTDWNGMMIAALAGAGEVLEEPRYIAAAERAGEFLWQQLRPGPGPLLHTWRRGRAAIPAFLADYTELGRGYLALHRASGNDIWLERAEELTDEMESRLRSAAGGYFQGVAGDDLLFRAQTVTDGALPAPNGIAILNLLALADLTGRADLRRRAAAALQVFLHDLSSYPQATQTLAMAALRFHASTPVGAPIAEPPAAVSGAPATLADLARRVVRARAISPRPAVGAWAPLQVEIALDPGWHVNANPASGEFLIPTRVEGRVRGLVYPPGQPFEADFSSEEVSVYTGEVVIQGETRSDASSVDLTYQVCDARRCLPPVRLRLAIESAAAE